MNCPNCKVEMEEGFTNGIVWQKARIWGTVGLAKLFNKSTKRVIAWKCSMCGKIELYSELK